MSLPTGLIVMKDKGSSTCKLIDITVLCDKNASSKELGQKCKYKDLEIEIHTMWRMKTEVVPIVKGALGTIKNVVENSTRSVSEAMNIRSLQKTCLLRTVWILCRILST